MLKLILASQSARRQSLLAQFGLAFSVVSADIDETPLPDETPAEMTLRLAREKARAIFSQYGAEYRVLGGDTTVALGNTSFGKPKDKTEAVEMLSALSGKTHEVYSAVAIYDHFGCDSLLSSTKVTFAALTQTQIQAYCDTEEPYDKAGAYGIQGPAGAFVESLQGSYTGVIGLPLWHTHQLLFNRNVDAK